MAEHILDRGPSQTPGNLYLQQLKEVEDHEQSS